MTLSLKDVTTGLALQPPRMILFGVEGVGKTTFVANAPSMIMLQVGEAGEGILDFPRYTPKQLPDFDAVLEALGAIYDDDGKYKTVGIDTVQGLEELIWREVCRDQGTNSIEEIGYAKGYIFALDYWGIILQALDDLQTEKGKQIILIGHVDIKTVTPPDADPYDNWVLNLHHKASKRLYKWADIIGFANFGIRQIKQKTGKTFDEFKTKTQATGRRILKLSYNPAHAAKNRYQLPEELELDYPTFEKALTAVIDKAEKAHAPKPKSNKP